MKRLRIAVTGPESSGKTTLVKMLSACFNAHIVDEYVREYAEKNQISTFCLDDLEKIAAEQASRNARFVPGVDLFVCDTEMLVIKIWADDKFKTCPESILYLYKEQKFDFILLCFPDVKWEYDPLRTDENRREELFYIYKNELDTQDIPYYIIKGQAEQRMIEAVSLVNRYSELKS